MTPHTGPPPPLTRRRLHPRLIFAIATSLVGVAVQHGTAFAHSGPPPAPEHLWESWSPQPSVLVGLFLAGWLYGRGLQVIWRRAGAGRGIRVWQAEAFYAGLATLFAALVSPLDALSSALFSAHMVQHLLLIVVAAPLLVLGVPLVPWLWALPISWRKRLGRYRSLWIVRWLWLGLTLPVVPWLLATGTLWAWHIPVLYEAALRTQWIHSLEHLCLLLTAALFWFVVARSGTHRLGRAVAIGYLLGMGLQGTVLGIALAFSPAPWYPAYSATTAVWHVTPLQDQQIAGLIMWIPAGAIHLLAAMALLARWLSAADPPARPRQLAQPLADTRSAGRSTQAEAGRDLLEIR